VTERTDFLYPFIERTGHDPGALLTDLAKSARGKLQASGELRAEALERTASARAGAAAAMADRFRLGGRLFVFGNGGSSTDAAALAALFLDPPSGTALPARHLVEDSAVLTALGNDVGFELVFSRQLIAHAVDVDIAIGISTSGNSANLLTAFAEAHRRHLLTIGLAGYSGGAMAQSADVEHCLVVEADSVHRIQETQAAIGLALWQAVQDELAGAPVPSGGL
jgi:D-sedoheptulose 7-phosphate isomerase